MTTASRSYRACTDPRDPAVADLLARVTIDNPPINVMGPEMVKEFQKSVNALEADEQVRVGVVFDSAGRRLLPESLRFRCQARGSDQRYRRVLQAWRRGRTFSFTTDPLASRLQSALIRGRATGNGSEITLACDMSFANQEEAIISAAARWA